MTFLRDLLKTDTRSPGLGAGYWDQVASDEKFPGISTTGDVSDFPDPDVPALPSPDEDMFSLLRQIRDRLPASHADVIWMTFVETLGAAAGSKTFRYRPEWRYFYLSNPTARAVSVYLGAGKTLFLGTLPAGKSMRGEMPFPQDDLTVTWAADASATDQITLIVSSGKIDITIV